MQNNKKTIKKIEIGLFVLIFCIFLFIIIADICGIHILHRLDITKLILYFLASIWLSMKAFMWAYKRKE